MTNRQRLSATVEAALLKAGQRAVAEGRAKNLSAWVNDALARQAEHDRRLKALDDFFREYEAEHGVITEEEIRSARRYYRSRTVRVGAPAEKPGARRKRGAA
jgi:phage tail sheath protein FI